jgi:hypothetical protein
MRNISLTDRFNSEAISDFFMPSLFVAKSSSISRPLDKAGALYFSTLISVLDFKAKLLYFSAKAPSMKFRQS